jgi:ankyrin repeat protein
MRFNIPNVTLFFAASSVFFYVCSNGSAELFGDDKSSPRSFPNPVSDFNDAFTRGEVLAKGGSLQSKKESLDEFTALLDEYPEVATKPQTEKSGWTLLHWVAEQNCPEAAAILLQHGADPLARFKSLDHTPLHTAAQYNSTEVIEVLLDAGVEIDILGGGPDEWELKFRPDAIRPLVSPLDVAASTGAADSVKLLLERGAKICANPAKSHSTALHNAMLGRHMRVGQIRKTPAGAPREASFGNAVVIGSLLQHGAHLDDVDYEGKTPLHIAVYYNSRDVIELLLRDFREQININQPDKYGLTPLHLAVSPLRANEVQLLAVVRMLIEHGADKGARTTAELQRRTAFEMASGELRDPRITQEVLDLLNPETP